MDDQLVEFSLNFSTADSEKTVSSENNPIYAEAQISTVFFPPGEYRLIAGQLVRMRNGLPPGDAQVESELSHEGEPWPHPPRRRRA